ncbi:hypothetical protein Hanom_Chr02g00123291 [Helianthus anomalus]
MSDERSRATGFALFFLTIDGFPTFPTDAPCSNIVYSVPTLPVDMIAKTLLLQKSSLQKGFRDLNIWFMTVYLLA